MKLRIYFGIAENFDEKKFDDNNNNGNTQIYFFVPKLCNKHPAGYIRWLVAIRSLKSGCFA